MEISIITTTYNEEKSIPLFYEKIKNSMRKIDYELIIVNDGSTDNTLKKIKKIAETNRRVKIISYKKNKGKSYALWLGLKKAKNNITATIDADLQDNPKDILKLAKKLQQKCDFVNGFREKRMDNLIKKISSKVGNFINNKILNMNLKDNNCPLKVFKKECVGGIKFFEHFHRFIPALARIRGYKICEEKVEHYPRLHGKSKYGMHNRIFGNLKTLFTIKFFPKKILKCS